MPTITLKAHFDGEAIRLDEPFDLPANARLMVTILPDTDGDRSYWLQTSAANLARAYGQNEPEYSERDIVPR